MTPFYSRDGITLFNGDCLDVLKTLPDASVEAVVTDPPYGLSFMGRDWDHGVPGEHFWREAIRVAKPGAHLLAFGGTRTFHRLASAIEDAGWEIRDCLMWVYGSGFPKSMDIGKAIDKAAGAEREVVGVSSVTGARKSHTMDDGCKGTKRTYQNDEPVTNHITAPATDAAKQWDGWGSALKPAWEPIILARKPVEGTIAANVLKHGVGGINIDATRIGTADSLVRPAVCRTDNNVLGKGLGSGTQEQPSGRFPSNALFSHCSPTSTSPGCVCTGTKRVKSTRANNERTSSSGDIYGGGKGIPSHTGVHGAADSDGLETVASYSCLAGCPCGHEWATAELTACPVCCCKRVEWLCPVAMLDEQSGTLASGVAVQRNGGGQAIFGGIGDGSNAIGARPDVGYGDVPSGASRFFQTFPPDATRFKYCPKAPSSERRQSKHPTQKPVDLMRYLVRLVCPIGGTVCDPFMGSGSTVEAARAEHCKAIGIDLSAEYCADAKARLSQGFLRFDE